MEIAGTIRPKIKSVKIKDCGIIKYAEMRFKDGLNVITGKNATGKTTMINAIMASCQKPPIIDGWHVATIRSIRWFLSMLRIFCIQKRVAFCHQSKTGWKILTFLRKNVYGKGKAEIEFFSDKNGEAVLIDDALARLDSEYRKKALEFFRKSKNQFIITCHDASMLSGLKANIIGTKEFELKAEGE